MQTMIRVYAIESKSRESHLSIKLLIYGLRDAVVSKMVHDKTTYFPFLCLIHDTPGRLVQGTCWRRRSFWYVMGCIAYH